MGAFPWGEPGTRLEKFTGPEPWQAALLTRMGNGLPLLIQTAIQEAAASGHGVGKSALVFLDHHLEPSLPSFPDTRGVVTANTENPA